MSKKGLGRGLQALIPASNYPEPGVREIPLHVIDVNPQQPRRKFSPDKLEELANSIKTYGVVQPIVVRSKGSNKYEIIAGERRFRACAAAGLNAIPAIIKDCSDAEMAEIALIENIQREDLDPMEEAAAYRALIEQFKFSQESLAERIGKSRPSVTNSLRLLSLPQQAQVYISEGKLTVGHAKVVMGLEDRSLQMLVVEKVVRSGCSVRETELLVKNIQEKTGSQVAKGRDNSKVETDPALLLIEEKLRSLLRTQVKVKAAGEKGKIEIEYYSKAELAQIVDTLLGELH